MVLTAEVKCLVMMFLHTASIPLKWSQRMVEMNHLQIQYNERTSEDCRLFPLEEDPAIASDRSLHRIDAAITS